jgi:hypothetical protein
MQPPPPAIRRGRFALAAGATEEEVCWSTRPSRIPLAGCLRSRPGRIRPDARFAGSGGRVGLQRGHFHRATRDRTLQVLLDTVTTASAEMHLQRHSLRIPLMRELKLRTPTPAAAERAQLRMCLDLRCRRDPPIALASAPTNLTGPLLGAQRNRIGPGMRMDQAFHIRAIATGRGRVPRGCLSIVQSSVQLLYSRTHTTHNSLRC